MDVSKQIALTLIEQDIVVCTDMTNKEFIIQYLLNVLPKKIPMLL
jgi:hypothetical protein